MFNRSRSHICQLALHGAMAFLSIVAGLSPAWSQTDITDEALPHTADSVLYDQYHWFDPSNVSDNGLGLYYVSWHSKDAREESTFPHWVTIDFGTPHIVTQLNILAYSEYDFSNLRLRDFRFEGSDDSVTYTPLHLGLLQYANQHEWQSFHFENAAGYRYYRLYGLNSWLYGQEWCDQMIIEEWEMFESPSAAAPHPAREDDAATLSVYPNPCRAETCLRVHTDGPGPLDVSLYNPSGQLVKTLIDETMIPGGVRFFLWDTADRDGRPVASGVYLCKVRTGGDIRTRRVLVTR